MASVGKDVEASRHEARSINTLILSRNEEAFAQFDKLVLENKKLRTTLEQAYTSRKEGLFLCNMHETSNS